MQNIEIKFRYDDDTYILEEEKDFNNWLAQQTTFAQTIQQ